MHLFVLVAELWFNGFNYLWKRKYITLYVEVDSLSSKPFYSPVIDYTVDLLMMNIRLSASTSQRSRS